MQAMRSGEQVETAQIHHRSHATCGHPIGRVPETSLEVLELYREGTGKESGNLVYAYIRYLLYIYLRYLL